jgi:hypothetical protein
MKMNGFARVMLVALLIPIFFLVQNSSAAGGPQPPNVGTQGVMAISPNYAFVGSSTEISFTPNSAIFTSSTANVFIVFDPQSNAINQGTAYTAVDPYALPTCIFSTPLTSVCVLDEEADIPADSSFSVQSQPWLPVGEYYYLGYIDSTPPNGCPSTTATCYSYLANTLNVTPPVNNIMTISAPKIPAGASTYINFTEYGSGCTAATVIELSAPGTSCVSPVDLVSTSEWSTATSPYSIYCNEDVNNVDNPQPPCQFDYANTTYNSLIGEYQCNVAVMTNATIPAGNYNVCAYYQATNTTTSPQRPTGPLSIAIGTLNITQNFGPTQLGSGVYLYPSQQSFDSNGLTGSPTITLFPNVSPGSPYISYYSPDLLAQEGDSVYPSPCSGSLSNPSSGAGCYFELALASSTGGCAPPAYGDWQSNGPDGFRFAYASCTVASGDTNGDGDAVPCLIPNPTSPSSPIFGGGGSATVSNTFFAPNGQYLLCAYDALPVIYQEQQSGSNDGTPLSTSNPNPIAPIFFSTTDITCVNGVCTFGTTYNESSEVSYGSIYAQLGNPIGYVNVAISPLYTSQGPVQSSVVANIVGAINNPINLYFVPITQTALSQNTLPVTCAIATQHVTAHCTGGNSDLSGCLISYTPTASFACNPNGAVPAGTSCTCSLNNIPYPGGPNGVGDACDITTNTPDQLPPPGDYLYCETYQNNFVAAGLLAVGGQSSPVSSPPGSASAYFITQELCSVYGTITTTLFIFALALALLGAVLYEGSSVLPAQARGSLQGWALGMVIGGIVGIVIAAFSMTVVSIVSNIPITSLLVGCMS